VTVAAYTAPFDAETDLDVSKVVLDVVNRKIKGLDQRIDESMTQGEVERTITGASTLTFTVHDPHRALLQSGMFDYTIEAVLDTYHWRLVKVQKQGDDLSLTFEDRVVSWLREGTTPKKASRDKMTRAEFAYSLVREIKKGGGIPFYSPDMHVKQPIAKAKQKKTSAQRKASRDPGVNRQASGLTVDGHPASSSQIRYAERLLDVANSLNAPPMAGLSLVEVAIHETRLSNPSTHTNLDSRGIIQVRDSIARGMHPPIDNMDVEQCANAFLSRGFAGKGDAISLARQNPSWGPGQIAVLVQGAGTATDFDRFRSDAAGFQAAYQGGSSAPAATSTTVPVPFQYQRGGTAGVVENSWDCLQRLAHDVNWRCYVTEGVVYFIADETLMQAKPTLVLNEQSPGVTTIDFDIDSGKVKDQVTITARASRWIANPGEVVELKDCGPADGRWLISDLRRSLFDADTTITLTRPSKALPEPAAQSKTVKSSGTAAAGTGWSADGTIPAGSVIGRIYEACQNLTAKAYPYVWAGGHGAAGVPSVGSPGPGYTGRTIGFDCSGSTCAALSAGPAGFNPGGPVWDSGRIATSWGAAGEGKYLTVWANPTHVFMVFHNVGKPGDEHFGTGRWPSGNGGAQFQQELHPTSGFTPRHWWGL